MNIVIAITGTATIPTQLYPPPLPDQLRNHFARPQSELKLQLKRVLRGDCLVKPSQFLAIQLRLTPRNRLGLQRVPAAAPIQSQPSVKSRPMNSDRSGNDFRTFSGLHTTHGPNPQLLKGLVAQSTRIVLPHVVNESLTNNDVNEYVD
jgi:hypothetical protein